METLLSLGSYAPGAGVTAFEVLAAFVQGLLSFFSPCVLPLIPLYIGYLAGGTGTVREDGSVEYPRRTVLVNTACFVVGVSFAFFLLGLGFSAVGRFFSDHGRAFSIVAGVIMAALGLYMLGAFGKARVLESERRLPFQLGSLAMNPLVALALGFTFSFAWTPCVGPMLAGVLLMASSASAAESFAGFALVGVYTLGFVLPFLAVGLFTSEVLRFFGKHRNIVSYTVKIGGALLVIMGVLTIAGLTGGFAASDGGSATDPAASSSAAEQGQDAAQDGAAPASDDDAAEVRNGYMVAPNANVEFVDQHGATHKLSDYRGKAVLLNFFATWCGPCKQEIPELQAFYEAQGENTGDVIFLGVANPVIDGYPNSSDGTVEEVAAFVEEQGITYPVLMDGAAQLFTPFGVSAFPTTFAIGPDGTIRGVAMGALNADALQRLLEKAYEED